MEFSFYMYIIEHKEGELGSYKKYLPYWPLYSLTVAGH